MKKYFSLLLPPALFASIIISCNNNKNAGSGEGSNTYTLKMRFNPGDKFKHVMDIEMESTVEAEQVNKKMTTITNMTSVVAFEVLNDSADLHAVRLTYEDMKINLTSGPNSSQEVNEAAKESMKKIVGKSVIILLNNKNEVVEVRGLKDIVGSTGTDPEMEAQLRQMFSKEDINSSFAMMFQPYPDKPVKVGDTWQKTLGFEMANIKMQTTIDYKLASVKDGIAYLDMKGIITGKGNFSQAGAPGIEMDLKGSQDGKMLVGLNDGYIKGGNYEMKVSGAMEMMGEKIPMSLNGKYVIKGE